jgi:hypothetical protein
VQPNGCTHFALALQVQPVALHSHSKCAQKPALSVQVFALQHVHVVWVERVVAMMMLGGGPITGSWEPLVRGGRASNTRWYESERSDATPGWTTPAASRRREVGRGVPAGDPLVVHGATRVSAGGAPRQLFPVGRGDLRRYPHRITPYKLTPTLDHPHALFTKRCGTLWEANPTRSVVYAGAPVRPSSSRTAAIITSSRFRWTGLMAYRPRRCRLRMLATKSSMDCFVPGFRT